MTRAHVGLGSNLGDRMANLDTAVRVLDADTAWVTCAENILSGGAGGPDMEDAKVLATNVFRRDGGRWLMVLHHGSPVLRP